MWIYCDKRLSSLNFGMLYLPTMYTKEVHPFSKIHIKKGAPTRPSLSGWLPKIGGRKLGHENNLSRHLNGSANAPS